MSRKPTCREEDSINFSFHRIVDHAQLKDVSGNGIERPVWNGLWTHLSLTRLIGPRIGLAFLAVLHDSLGHLLGTGHVSPSLKLFC